jgi:hypothetical protein
MGLMIPAEEMDLCKSQSRACWEALARTNDLYSWEKERDDSARAVQQEVVNAIWILMRQYSDIETEAKELYRNKIIERVAVGVEAVRKTKDDTSLSLDLWKYNKLSCIVSVAIWFGASTLRFSCSSLTRHLFECSTVQDRTRYQTLSPREKPHKKTT